MARPTMTRSQSLPNRTLFQARLGKALAEAKQNRTPVCLLLIDLDDFKDVNDSFGHDAGDALLRETARRLSRMVTACDTAARLGGDEFAVLLTRAIPSPARGGVCRKHHQEPQPTVVLLCRPKHRHKGEHWHGGVPGPCRRG